MRLPRAVRGELPNVEVVWGRAEEQRTRLTASRSRRRSRSPRRGRALRAARRAWRRRRPLARRDGGPRPGRPRRRALGCSLESGSDGLVLLRKSSRRPPDFPAGRAWRRSARSPENRSAAEPRGFSSSDARDGGPRPAATEEATASGGRVRSTSSFSTRTASAGWFGSAAAVREATRGRSRDRLGASRGLSRERVVQADPAELERRRDDATPYGPQVVHDAKLDTRGRMSLD